MFITTGRGGYDRHGEQVASGLFLMLFNQKPGGELRACVRHVHMRQTGHFMMGRARVGACRITLSGTYGGDGLPRDPPEGLWAKLLPLPQDLTGRFWKGGGHNSAGSEGPDIHEWAKANLKALRNAGR